MSPVNPLEKVKFEHQRYIPQAQASRLSWKLKHAFVQYPEYRRHMK